MGLYYKRLVVSDHRREVVLGARPSKEGWILHDGPYADALEAARYAGGPPQEAFPRKEGSMGWYSLGLVDATDRPADIPPPGHR